MTFSPAAILDAPVFDTADTDAVDHFNSHGWLLTQTLDETGAADLRTWVDEISQWGDDGDWLHHREMTDDGPKLCRSENIIPFHDGFHRLLTSGALTVTASALLGESAVLYKEKINYKLPGGAGYAPHQDAPAYPFVHSHVSAMVAVDAATIENGCLEVASGLHHELIETDAKGCVPESVAASMTWRSVEVKAGQTLWFHSLTPHRSGPNLSNEPRRALYPTYNALSEGDLRAAYYQAKLDEFAHGEGSGNDVQVSLIGDFQGRAV